jgi:hypothetical protein
VIYSRILHQYNSTRYCSWKQANFPESSSGLFLCSRGQFHGSQ